MTRPRSRSRTAFTLVEILVVVAIIGTLAVLGFQQVLRARITTYEQLALSSLRLIARSCHFFFLVYQRYPAHLNELGNAEPPYITPDLMAAAGTPATKQGYEFRYVEAGADFTVNADPQTPGTTGVRRFYTDQNLTIHVNYTGPASSSDPVLE
jgi:prepilin-type N-terminal cleavage/methylation domain-containing protein